MAEEYIPLGKLETREYSISFHDAHRDNELKDEGTTVSSSNGNREETGGCSDSFGADNTAPLIRAVRGGTLKTSRFFQKHKSMDVSLQETDRRQKNCFHNAITKPDVLKILLERFKTHPTLELVLKQEDENGETAIHRAALLGNVKSLEILYEHDNALMKQRSKVNKRCVLHFAVKSSSTVTVQFVLNKDPEQMNKVDSMSRTPAHFAATVEQKEIITLLISRGADPMRKDANCRLPIHAAANKGLLNIVEFLINDNSESIDSSDNTRQTPLMLAAKNGFPQVVTYLLSKGAKYKLKDNSKCSAFDLAVINEKSEVVEVFLNKDYWKEILQKSKLGPEQCLVALVETMPNTSVQLLDKCIQVHGSIKEPESHMVIYDFFCLESAGDGYSTFEVLQLMAENMIEECLSHPLCVKFVNLKWRKRGFKYHLAATLLAVLFHVCLILFASQVLVRTEGGTRNSMNCTNSPGAIRENVGMSRADSGWMIALRVIMLIILFPTMLKELYQIKVQRLKYFFQLKHCVRWTLDIAVLMFLFPVNEKTTGLQNRSGVISIFVSWIKLMQYLRMVPVLGVYILVILKVFRTVMKIFVVVFLFLLSFASTFYITLAEFKCYHNFGVAIVSTLIAMISGPSYDDEFVKKNKMHPDQYGLNMVVIVLFIIVMSIVVNNTLIGLAVGDTDEVMKSAKLEKIREKVLFTIHLEKTLNRLPWFNMNKDGYLTEYPGLRKQDGERVLDIMYSTVSLNVMEDALVDKYNEQELGEELENNFEKFITAKIENIHSTLRMELVQILEEMKENNEKDIAKREVMEQKIDNIFEKLS